MLMAFNVMQVVLHHVQKKRDQQDFVHNFDKFKCIIIISGKQCLEGNIKLIVQPLSDHLFNGATLRCTITSSLCYCMATQKQTYKRSFQIH